jgi:hypothetical protein
MSEEALYWLSLVLLAVALLFGLSAYRRWKREQSWQAQFWASLLFLVMAVSWYVWGAGMFVGWLATGYI